MWLRSMIMSIEGKGGCGLLYNMITFSLGNMKGLGFQAKSKH